MSTREDTDRLVLMQGTLDVLILRTLIFGPEHGQGIARAIQQTSEDELLVEHGALYPALQRLEAQKLISAEVGHVSQQSQGALLHADEGRTRALGEAVEPVASARRGDGARARAGTGARPMTLSAGRDEDFSDGGAARISSSRRRG